MGRNQEIDNYQAKSIVYDRHMLLPKMDVRLGNRVRLRSRVRKAGICQLIVDGLVALGDGQSEHPLCWGKDRTCRCRQRADLLKTRQRRRVLIVVIVVARSGRSQ